MSQTLVGIAPRRSADRAPAHAFAAPARRPVQDRGTAHTMGAMAGALHDFSRFRILPAESPGYALEDSEMTYALRDDNVADAGGADAGTAADAGTPATPTFPTFAQITADSTVSAAFDAAWSATKTATTRTARREQGFWIKYDTTAATYTCAPTFTGPTVGPGQTGAADPGSKPADSAPTYTVGLFHTHTPMTYRTGGTRDVGPSDADNRFHTTNNVVGCVYDYEASPAGSGSIPAGHPLNSAAKVYSSGPTQRT